jgi:hypothetical protein
MADIRTPRGGHRTPSNQRATCSTPIDVGQLRSIVRDEVRRMLAPLMKDAPTHYSTRRGHAPPGWSVEAWRTVAATIPGSYTPGRWTIVPRAAFDAWIASRSTSTRASTAPANDAPVWDPSSVLTDLGLRSAREGA